jgi:hypothetical protein
MVKKTLATIAALGLVLSAAAFASGQKEPPAAGSGAPGSGAPGQAAPAQAARQKIVLTGPLSYKNLIHPTVKSGDKVFELLVPRHLIFEAGLKEGSQVTVEGYKVPEGALRRPGDDGENEVFVTKATVDGKEYDLSRFRGGPGFGRRGGRGPGYGQQWGRGPGRGYGRGPMMGGGPGCDMWDDDDPGSEL